VVGSLGRQVDLHKFKATQGNTVRLWRGGKERGREKEGGQRGGRKLLDTVAYVSECVRQR